MVDFPTTGGKIAHGFYYPPQNKDYVAPEGELPPLIVQSHGGPTSSTATALRYQIQYWTSRGFAVLDVDYGGSTNYGREYRSRLNGQWGIVDIDDCVNGAKYLIEEGWAIPTAWSSWGGAPAGTPPSPWRSAFLKAGSASAGSGSGGETTIRTS